MTGTRATAIRSLADEISATTDDLEDLGRGIDRLTAELRTERRLRQRAQADVLNLLSLLSGLPLGALVDAGLTTADLALIDRIEERWTKEPAQ